MLNVFLDFLKNEKRYSNNTILAYQNDINQFNEFLKEFYELNDLIDQVDVIHLRSWSVYLIDSGNSARTVNRKLTSLKSFYKFLLSRKIIAVNPSSSLRGPKVSKKLPSFVSEKEIIQIFDNVIFDDEFENRRNRLMIELFYATGIRLSELVNLKFGDVLWGESAIKVLGKRSKERIIPIYRSLLSLLKDYVKTYLGPQVNNPYIFLTKKGSKVYPKLVYRVVNTYLSGTASSEKRSPHVMRHTFATHLLNNGADLNTIKELLGHTSLSATQVYTHNSIEKLKKIYQQAHPRA